MQLSDNLLNELFGRKCMKTPHTIQYVCATAILLLDHVSFIVPSIDHNWSSSIKPKMASMIRWLVKSGLLYKCGQFRWVEWRIFARQNSRQVASTQPPTNQVAQPTNFTSTQPYNSLENFANSGAKTCANLLIDCSVFKDKKAPWDRKPKIRK